MRAAIDCNITVEHEFMMAILAEMLATIKRDITSEIDEKIGLLKADVALYRAIGKGENVIDMPDFLRRAS